MSLSAWLLNLASIPLARRPKTLARLRRPRATSRLRFENMEERITPTHLRYANLSWTPTTGVTDGITFHLTEAFRASAYGTTTAPPVVGQIIQDTLGGTPSLIFDKNNTGFNSGVVNYRITSVPVTPAQDPTNGGYVVAEAVHSVNGSWVEGLPAVYSAPGTYTAYLQGAARLTNLKDDGGGTYRFQTVVTIPSSGSPPDTPPVSSLPPIVQVAANSLNSFQIPATEPDGNPIRYRPATAADATQNGAGPYSQPTNLTISSTGLVTWDLRAGHGVSTVAGDLWTSQVIIEEYNPANPSVVISSVPVDFILQVVSNANSPPTVTANPAGPFTIQANQNVSFVVTANDPNQFGVITNLVATNPPTGMTFSTFTQGNPSAITVNWTPNSAQAGQTYVVTFQATDADGLTGTTSVSITVPANPPPTVTPPGTQPSVEGSATSFSLGSFTDVGPGPWTVTVNWGDGSADTTFSASLGTLPTQSHTYAEEGTETVTVTVRDTGDFEQTPATFQVNVADAALTTGDLTPPAAVEGQAFTNQTIFHFTDADPAGTAGDYTAVVSLGGVTLVTLNSTPSANGQIVAHPGGGFDVQLSATFPEELVNKTFAVSVRDTGGASTSASTNTFNVADAPLSVGQFSPPVATEGIAFANQTVLHFSDADPAGSAGDYTATVDLGDGNTVTLTNTAGPHGQIVANAGGFDVQLSYKYAEEMTGATFRVTVSDEGGAAPITASTSTFSVADAPITASGTTIDVTEGTGFTKVVATFTDANTNPDINDLSATITWNDGATTSGQIDPAGGGFTVTGTHTYTEEGTYAIAIAIHDLGGSNAAASSTANVGDAALQAGAPQVINFTEGAAFAGTVASFTDANTFATAADFTATINWGGAGSGSTTGTVVQDGPGQFHVTGGFTYAEEGSYPITVSITDDGGKTAQAGATAIVADAALTAGALTPPSAVEGQTVNDVIVFHFTDADPAATATDYHAVITVGDGTTVTVTGTPGPNGRIVASGGGFDVRLTYTYAEELPPTQTFGVVVTDNVSSAQASVNTFGIQDAALHASGVPVSATEGAQFSGPVATFTDANPGDHSGDFTATIDWGDNATSAGTVTYNAGTHAYTVAGAHTYAEEGSYQISVSVSDDGGSTDSTTTLASVADAKLTGSAGATAGGTEGASDSSVLANATFADANPGDHSGDFTATIDWGDNATSTGTVTYDSVTHKYTVGGTHTYAEDGGYNLTITVTDIGGKTTTITGRAMVADAAIDVEPVNFAATEGQSFTGVVATFTDANPNATPGDFSATILWGDGGSSPGLIGSDGHGGFTVTGTHTYTEEGTFVENNSPVVNVFDTGSSANGTDEGRADVADAPLTGSGAATATGGVANTTGASLSNATFTDANHGAPASDFTVQSVDWGDGTTSTAGLTVSGSNGTYTVSGSHVYPAHGTYQFTITVLDEGGQTATISGSTYVNPQTSTLANAIYPTALVEGSTGNVLDLTGTGFENGATVYWSGPGFANPAPLATTFVSTTELTAQVPDAYVAEEGGWSVLVQNPGAALGSGFGTSDSEAVQVTDAAITATATPVTTAVEGAPFSGEVATFTDANPGATTADFPLNNIVIHWGDGGTSNATSVTKVGGTFHVFGTHTYAEEGPTANPLSVTVTDKGGAISNATSYTPTVLDAQPTIARANGTVTVNEGTTATNTGTFHDPVANSDLTLTASVGTVTQDNAGTWSWSYPTTLGPEQSQPVTITATDNGGAVATTTFNLVVVNVPPTVTSVTGTGVGPQTYYFPNLNFANGSVVSGPISLPGGSQVQVTFSATNADGTPGNYYAQTTQINGVGTNYWNLSNGHQTNPDIYESSQVANQPPNADIIALSGGQNETYTVTFSQPIVNPIMDIVSLGQLSVPTTYNFDSPFTILSQGAGFFGGGSNKLTSSTDPSSAHPYILTGREGSGTIQFQGTFSSISWLVPTPETWHGFTFGILNSAAQATTTVNEGQTATNSGTFSDPGADDVIITASVGTITQTHGNSGTWQWSYPNAEETSSQTVTITADDQNGLTSTTTFPLTVLDPPVHATAGSSFSAIEGNLSAVQTLATFTDPGGAETPADYSVDVNWGNGTFVANDANVSITGPVNGVFTVTGSHLYPEKASGTIQVRINHESSTPPPTVSVPFTVADAALTPSTSASATGGIALRTPSTLSGATFTDANPTGPLGDFSIQSVNWGDGSTDKSGLTISGGGGSFTVNGSHQYAVPNHYSFSITVKDADGSTATIQGTADVISGVPKLTGIDRHTATEGDQGFTLTLTGESFFDGLSVVQWNGSPLATTYVSDTSLTAVVPASVLAEEGTATVTVVNPGAGGGTSGGQPFTINDAALTAGALTPPVATEGQPFSDVTVFKFTDANPGATADDYTAVVTLGDGNTVTLTGTPSASGQVVANDSGFSVQLSYTYADELTNKMFAVQVTDDGGQATSASTSTFGVADAGLTGSSAATAGGIEGFTNSSVLTNATFTDANPGNNTADMSATIHWGDNQTSTGVVSYSGGTYRVSGSHTYADEGSYQITIDVSDVGGQTTTITGTATVSDAALTGSSAATAGGTEGIANSSVLAGATFTDANPGNNTADMSATITWGDGTPTSTGTVSYDSNTGKYTVNASHTYSEEGTYNFSVAVKDAGGSTTTVTGTATVGDAGLSAAGVAVTAVEGAGFTLPVATFTDANPGDHSGDMTATITWGDNQSDPGVISYSGGTYTVRGTHTYADEGSFPITVSIHDVGGSSAQASTSATVSDAALTGSASATAGGIEGITNSSVLSNATFTDANPGNNSADMSAVIYWGDGQHSAGTVSYSGGTYSVAGSHTYADEGQYSITVNVSDVGGKTTTITGTATVADAGLTGSSAATAGGTEGIANSSVLANATFTDANPGNNTADMSAKITWGDGQQSNGTVSYANGKYTVNASHTYAEEGTYNFSIAVKDVGGQTTTITGTATVADAGLTASAGPNFTPGVAIPFANQLLATLTDATPAGGAADFTATINWGDGFTSTGTVALVSHGASTSTYQVLGGHTYASTGSFPITVNIVDIGGSHVSVAGQTALVQSNIVVLNPTADGALTVSGQGAIKVTGTVMVDSSSATGLSENGQASITAPTINVHGSGYKSTPQVVNSSTPHLNVPSVADPLAGLTAPTGLPNRTAVSLSGGTTTLNPGVYPSITLSGTAQVTLSPGIYVIAGGGFSATGQAVITGTGVLIYNAGSNFLNGGAAGGTYGSISISGQAKLNISPITSGAYAGIAIWQSGYASQSGVNAQTVSLTGQSILPAGGLIYAPAAPVQLSGQTVLGTNGNMSMIANTVSITGNAVFQLSSPAGGPAAYGPGQVRSAYGVNGLALDGTGQTIAIVDAYDDPAIAQSLDLFDSEFGTTAGGRTLYDVYGPASTFLSVLNQDGQAGNLPAIDPSGAGAANWEMETALDVEWAHAMAPGAKIVLVEASSQSLSDLMAAVSTAAHQPGVSVVSMSWGFPESRSVVAEDEALYDSAFNVSGVTFVASTGDYGSADFEYPAASPNVVAVGGSSLTLSGDNAYGGETAWGYASAGMGVFVGSGGGVSGYEAEPAFQQGVQSTGHRSTPDVAMIADPETGAWVADAYNLGAGNAFEVVGGTSLSAPSWAGLFALVNQGRAAAAKAPLNAGGPTEAAAALYSLSQDDFNVIASGTNGGFNAAAGYNLVTGLGSPVAGKLIPDLVADNAAATGRVAPISADLHANAGFTSSVSNADVANALPVFAAMTFTPHVAAVMPAAAPHAAPATVRAATPAVKAETPVVAAPAATVAPVSVAIPPVVSAASVPTVADAPATVNAYPLGGKTTGLTVEQRPDPAARPAVVDAGTSKDVLLGGDGDDIQLGADGRDVIVGGFGEAEAGGDGAAAGAGE